MLRSCTAVSFHYSFWKAEGLIWGWFKQSNTTQTSITAEIHQNLLINGRCIKAVIMNWQSWCQSPCTGQRTAPSHVTAGLGGQKHSTIWCNDFQLLLNTEFSRKQVNHHPVEATQKTSWWVASCLCRKWYPPVLDETSPESLNTNMEKQRKKNPLPGTPWKCEGCWLKFNMQILLFWNQWWI